MSIYLPETSDLVTYTPMTDKRKLALLFYDAPLINGQPQERWILYSRRVLY